MLKEIAVKGSTLIPDSYTSDGTYVTSGQTESTMSFNEVIAALLNLTLEERQMISTGCGAG